MTTIRLAGISGSLRKNSHNTAILRTLQDRLSADIELALLPLDDLPLYNPDLEAPELPASVAAFKAAVQAADGLVVCSPEYNAGTSGVLKNALDWVVGSGELIDKPIVLINASPQSKFAVAQLSETLTVMSAKIAGSFTLFPVEENALRSLIAELHSIETTARSV